MLTDEAHDTFRKTGHVTVPQLLAPQVVADAVADVEAWSLEFLNEMTEAQQKWFLEQQDPHQRVLRKLDEPVFHRSLFREMASSPPLVRVVEQLIGEGVTVFFSQVFCKPPEIGGPKPVHQDNYYFGPDDPDATLTVWIALDDATVQNGCLYYGNGSHQGPIYEHEAPEDEPYNLQIPEELRSQYVMTPAPVTAGGVSFHHGNTWHQSSSNTSSVARRAAAFHYLRNDAKLIQPALDYDPHVAVRIT